MSRIHSKDTKPEEMVRKYLFSKGFRYRKNDERLPGKPDIVLPKYHTVIFINGCFWHKHEKCRFFVWPKSNVDFWKEKINANAKRNRIYVIFKRYHLKSVMIRCVFSNLRFPLRTFLTMK